MATNFGKTPRDNLGNFINLKELNDIRQTGFYEMVISSASIKSGVSDKGNAWQSINLGLAVMNHGQPVGRIYDTEFISANSQRLQDICFFANLRDAEDNVICPDPTTIEYIDKTSGEQKTFQEIAELKNIRIFGVVEYTGEKTMNNGNSYPQYKIHFCSEDGRTATEVALNNPATTLLPMLQRLNVKTNDNVRTQQNVQTSQAPRPLQSAQPQQSNVNSFGNASTGQFGNGPASQAYQQFQQQQRNGLQQRAQMNQFEQAQYGNSEPLQDELPF